MRSTVVRRVVVGLQAAAVGFFFLGASGCGENPEQRQSGTLVKPLDSVERAGEAAGKAEDATKKKK